MAFPMDLKSLEEPEVLDAFASAAEQLPMGQPPVSIGLKMRLKSK